MHQVRDVIMNCCPVFAKTPTGFLGLEKTVFTLLASHGQGRERLREVIHSLRLCCFFVVFFPFTPLALKRGPAPVMRKWLSHW